MAFSTDHTLTLSPTPCHLAPSAQSASPAAAAHHASSPRRPQPQRAAAKQAKTGTTAQRRLLQMGEAVLLGQQRWQFENLRQVRVAPGQ